MAGEECDIRFKTPCSRQRCLGKGQKVQYNRLVVIDSILHTRFNGLVVMISVLHTEGPQFDPGLNHVLCQPCMY